LFESSINSSACENIVDRRAAEYTALLPSANEITTSSLILDASTTRGIGEVGIFLGFVDWRFGRFAEGKNGVPSRLLSHAEKVKVAHPLMLRAIAAAKRKDDKIDASKIADCLSAVSRCCPPQLEPWGGGFINGMACLKSFHVPLQFEANRTALLSPLSNPRIEQPLLPLHFFVSRRRGSPEALLAQKSSFTGSVAAQSEITWPRGIVQMLAEVTRTRS
jgi:hypothetical protein